MVFSGRTVGEARLVSGYPESFARFPARSGETYRIAVAAGDAFAGGGRFDLSWKGVGREAGNDEFTGATGLAAAESASWSAEVDSLATVEPDEPADTGVRTRWWSWTAPASGESTWRLSGPAGLTLTGFSGASLDALAVLGSAPATGIEFSFGARRNETYCFAVGMATGHPSAFTESSVGGTVDFGPTPSNDAWSRATALAGASGTVTGSNRYATTEPHERIRTVGHSSVWWTFEAPADGWYRFWVDETHLPFTLSAYEHGAGSAAQLEMIVSSRRGAGIRRIEIAIEVEWGESYAIRLGTFGNASGGDFTLHWEETEPQNLLRYLGRFTPESGDDQIERLGAMAIDSTGQALYVTSPDGLSVLGRDSETGTLTGSQLLPGDLEGAAVSWDGDNTRLLVFKDCEAKRYEAVDNTYRRLRDAGALTVSGAAPCIDGRVFIEGTFVYGVRRGQDIRVYALESGDSLRHVQTLELPSVQDAGIANAAGHVYAVEDHVLHILERDEATGEIAELARKSLDDQVFSLAVSHDDTQVFTFGRVLAFVHDVQDPTDPRLVGYLTPPTPFLTNINCEFAIARNERRAADAFCVDSAYVVQWESSTNELRLADFVSDWQTNRYGRLLPDFGWPRGVAASPDSRHAYLATGNHGILMFERVGNTIVEVHSDP